MAFLPAESLTKGGGVFYTNYDDLQSAFGTVSTATNGAMQQFMQETASFSLSSSLFQLFNNAELVEEVKLDWHDLAESAWMPLAPLEVARGSFDWTAMQKALVDAGYTTEPSGQAVLYNAPYSPENPFGNLGELAFSGEFLVMEHYLPYPNQTMFRSDILSAISRTVTSIADSETWIAYSPFLSQAPSFFLGPAPISPGTEQLVSLDPTTTPSNLVERAMKRSAFILGADFLYFCAFPDLADEGKVTFILRYSSEASADADMTKISPGIRSSYSQAFPGETFLYLLGEPLVSREGQFLRVVTRSQTGIKILQAFVLNRDFGFLFKSAAE